ncbi:hypothetical protein [Bacillus stratosphericus]|uniref:hypothetical protein n=1 Tax=Bacillus stratosphericus TaxID=293386 RepID=UPI001CF99CE4|nr:hypothetical protein [Bacillus stratosphericus]
MGLSYVTFMKHAEKITKKTSSGRSVLKGVYHSEDGSLVVTDSHRLYLAKNISRGVEGTVLDPKTGVVIEGKYPDVRRLFPDEGTESARISFDIDILLPGLLALLKCNQVNKKERSFITLTASSDKETPEFSCTNKFVEAKVTVGAFNKYSAISLSVDTQYLIDAVNLFKASQITAVVLNYYGNIRPFTITAENNSDLIALIMPIRRDGVPE